MISNLLTLQTQSCFKGYKAQSCVKITCKIKSLYLIYFFGNELFLHYLLEIQSYFINKIRLKKIYFLLKLIRVPTLIETEKKNNKN